jgi:hypothetical protein
VSFHPLPYNFYIVKSTLCYQLMVSTHWQTLSSPTPFELIWFHELFFLMGLLGQLWLKQKMVPNKHVSPSSCKGFWMFSPTCKRVTLSMCQHVVRSKRHCRPSFLNFARNLYSDVTTCVSGLYFETCCSIGEDFSRLNILSKGHPFFLFDMFFTIKGGSGTWCSPCGSPS